MWVKSRAGTGYWFRNRHEYLLVGIRGNVPAPAPGDQPESVINAANTEHSRKPEIVAEISLPPSRRNSRSSPIRRGRDGMFTVTSQVRIAGRGFALTPPATWPVFPPASAVRAGRRGRRYLHQLDVKPGVLLELSD